MSIESETNHSSTDEIQSKSFSALDVFGFLLGRRQSIDRILETKDVIWLGAALVFTAALSREYDAVSLIHRPFELLGSFGASIVLSGILYVVIVGCLHLSVRYVESLESSKPTMNYLGFLAGYWMTAPLAWMYAIPIEQFTTEIFALKFNLTMLSIVSIWRILLFSRFVSVRQQVPFIVALSWVLVPCMVIAFVALINAVLSMVSIMGGLKLTETQIILRDYKSSVMGLIFYFFIPVLVFFLVSMVWLGKHRALESVPRKIDSTVGCSSWALCVFVALIILGGAVYFQPKLFRAKQVDNHLALNQVDQAIDLMRNFGPDAFPKVWDPLPNFPNGDDQHPQLQTLAEGLIRKDSEPWISDRLLVQIDEIAMRQIGWTQGTKDESYLRSMLPYESPGAIAQVISCLELLQKIPVTDSTVSKDREKLLEIVREALLQSKQNAMERSMQENGTPSDGVTAF